MLRDWLHGIAIAPALLAFSVPAAAAPSYSLVWTGTTGTGTTGGTMIEAEIGDEITLNVIINIDAEGFTGAAWDLVGSAGLTAAANGLVSGAGGPPECPAPPNLAPGTCFSTGFKSFTPLMVGVVDAGSNTTGYDTAGLTAEFTPSTMTIGAGVFVVGAGAGAFETVETFFAPGSGGVTDGVFAFSVPSVATATIQIALPPMPLTKDQQKCADAIQAASQKVTKAILKQQAGCLKRFQRGKPLNKGVPSIDTLEECVGDDPNGKIAKAEQKVGDAFTRRCEGMDKDGQPRLPVYAVSDPATSNAASTQKELDLVHDVFAPDLDAGSLVTREADPKAAACQLEAHKAVARCQQTKQSAYRTCAKDALSGKSGPGPVETPSELQDDCLGTGADAQPDPKGRIMKRCTDPAKGIEKSLLKKCGGQDLDALFACELACAADDIACVASCLETAVECRFCQWANATADLGRDCDAFDDGATNGSCPAAP